MYKDTFASLDDLQISPEYADFIMKHATMERPICNGDQLTIAQEEGYLFEEFVSSLK